MYKCRWRLMTGPYGGPLSFMVLLTKCLSDLLLQLPAPQTGQHLLPLSPPQGSGHGHKHTTHSAVIPRARRARRVRARSAAEHAQTQKIKIKSDDSHSFKVRAARGLITVTGQLRVHAENSHFLNYNIIGADDSKVEGRACARPWMGLGGAK